VTFSGGGQTGSAATATGGSLGVPGNGRGGSGLLDLAAVILVPWALDANTAAMLDAAVYRAFEIAPQIGAMIVAGCDSHVSGYGTTFQQSWPREMIERLGRHDVQLVNFGKPGETVQNCYVNNFWLPQTALQGTNMQRWMILEGGYNDLNAGRTVAQIEADYATGAANAHGLGVKVACMTDMLRNAAAGINANMQTLNASLRTNAGGFCDLVIDLAAYSIFNAGAGPWNPPWFEQQDSGIHLSSQGNGLVAEIIAQAFKGVLQ
jgi:lysophospholipase L1-like esterase